MYLLYARDFYTPEIFQPKSILVHIKRTITPFIGYLLASRKTLMVKMLIEQEKTEAETELWTGYQVTFPYKAKQQDFPKSDNDQHGLFRKKIIP